MTIHRINICLKFSSILVFLPLITEKKNEVVDANIPEVERKNSMIDEESKDGRSVISGRSKKSKVASVS